MTEAAWDKIKAFAFDIDGVLTNDGLIATETGELYRTFGSKDGFAIRMASMRGYPVAIITGARSLSIQKRFLTCGVPEEDIYLHSRDKMKDFRKFCERHSLEPEEVLYCGDDIPDIAVMQACGIGACPADAVPETLAIADYVSPRNGGQEFARDVVEKVLKLNGDWVFDVGLYEARF